jgi:di/tricarboxylate transporter
MDAPSNNKNHDTISTINVLQSNGQYNIIVLFVCLMMFNTTFNNISAISWRSALLVEETGGSGKHHRPVASH